MAAGQEGRGPWAPEKPEAEGRPGRRCAAQARRPWGVACRGPGLAGGRTWALLSGAGLLAGSTEGAGLTQRGGRREAFWEMETPRRALKLSRMTRKGERLLRGEVSGRKGYSRQRAQPEERHGMKNTAARQGHVQIQCGRAYSVRQSMGQTTQSWSPGLTTFGPARLRSPMTPHLSEPFLLCPCLRTAK